MSADVEMGVGGFVTGAMAGAMVSLATASHHVANDVRRQQKNLATVQNWSIALDRARQRATAAERQVQRQELEIAQLKKALAYAELELNMWRNS